MAPLSPIWAQPSHPDIQHVIFSTEPDTYMSKSISKIAVPPFGLFAKMSFPPCTIATRPTYATVQMGKDSHLNLNSDLVFINHSCEPSLILDMPSLSMLAGPKGIAPGDELTFFYPSTEWEMAQPFDCFCGSKSCRGWIEGAGRMGKRQLEGMWLNGYIRQMLEERDAQKNGAVKIGNGKIEDGKKAGYENGIVKREKLTGHGHEKFDNGIGYLHRGKTRTGDAEGTKLSQWNKGQTRRGPTSRELSGEMGGDTIA